MANRASHWFVLDEADDEVALCGTDRDILWGVTLHTEVTCKRCRHKLAADMAEVLLRLERT